MATYKTKKPYMYGTGRRKSSIARVHLIPNGSGVITINGRDIDDYFGLETLKLIVRQPLVTTGTVGKVDIEATVAGGGVSGQAGAIRHGIARALLVVDENNRAALKAAGLLTRDPRMKERAVQQALIRYLQAPASRRVLVFFMRRAAFRHLSRLPRQRRARGRFDRRSARRAASPAALPSSASADPIFTGTRFSAGACFFALRYGAADRGFHKKINDKRKIMLDKHKTRCYSGLRN